MSDTNILNLVSEETYVSKMDTKNAILENIAEGLGGVVDGSFVENSEHPVQSKVIKSALDNKVDKETGKGLSTNDYTTAEKDKLAGLSNITVDTALSTTSENPVQNKVVKAAIDAKYTASNATTSARGLVKIGSNINISSGTISVPIATTSTYGVVKVDSALSSTSTNPVQNKAIYTALASKVSAVSGKGLSTNDYTTEEKNKLASLSTQDIEDIKRFLYPTITAEGVQGIPVTFTKGDRVLSQIPDETATATEYIPEFGTWTVATSINGLSVSKNVNVEDVMNKYTVTTGLIKSTSTSALSQARYELAATTVGDYALFGGGYASYDSDIVDTYTSSLVKSTATSLSQARYELAATTVGDYALFGGGSNYSTVDAYNTSLVKSTPTALSQARSSLAATTVGDYALFGGGFYQSVSTKYSTVDTYTSSLVKSTATSLSVSTYNYSATTVGNYALFGCGSGTTAVNAYSSTLVRSRLADCSESSPSSSSSKGTATYVGNYALFTGHSILDTYTSSLVKSTATSLSQARYELAATTVGDYALFGGGYVSGTGSSDIVDTYTSSLVKSTATSLSQARSYPSATTVGNYALFGGGNRSSSSTTKYSTVDSYKYDYI